MVVCRFPFVQTQSDLGEGKSPQDAILFKLILGHRRSRSSKRPRPITRATWNKRFREVPASTKRPIATVRRSSAESLPTRSLSEKQQVYGGRKQISFSFLSIGKRRKSRRRRRLSVGIRGFRVFPPLSLADERGTCGTRGARLNSASSSEGSSSALPPLGLFRNCFAVSFPPHSALLHPPLLRDGGMDASLSLSLLSLSHSLPNLSLRRRALRAFRCGGGRSLDTGLKRKKGEKERYGKKERKQSALAR